MARIIRPSLYDRVGVLANFGIGAEQAFVRRLWDIDLSSVGIDSCSCPYDFYKRCVVNQALVDGLSNSVQGLCIRDMIAWRDFALDGESMRDGDIWPNGLGYQTNNDIEWIFDNYRHDDRTTSIIYGLKNLTEDGQLYFSHVFLELGHIKVMDINNVQTARLKETTGVSLFNNAVLFRRGDRPAMKVRTTHDAKGKHDRIMVLGITVEQLGSTMVG